MVRLWSDYGQIMVQTFVRQMNKTFVRLSQGKRKTFVRQMNNTMVGLSQDVRNTS